VDILIRDSAPARQERRGTPQRTARERSPQNPEHLSSARQQAKRVLAEAIIGGDNSLIALIAKARLSWSVPVILIDLLLCHATDSGSATDVKERTLDGFISNRMIAYYERDGAQPPGAILVEVAKALRVSTDELLGVRPVREALSPKTARLLKRLRRVEELPPPISAPSSSSSTPCSKPVGAPRRGPRRGNARRADSKAR
jgi:hypothetical protein